MTMKQQRGAFSGWYMAGVSTLQRGKSVCMPVSPGWRPPSLTASAVEESYGARSVRMLETGRMCPKPMDVRLFEMVQDNIYLIFNTLFVISIRMWWWFDGDFMVINGDFSRIVFFSGVQEGSPFYGDRWWFDGGAWWFSLGVPRPEIGLHFSLLFLFFVYWHFVSPVICLQVASS